MIHVGLLYVVDFEIIMHRTDLPPQPLEFIVSGGPSSTRDQRARKTIRSHVMYNYRREERLKTASLNELPIGKQSALHVCQR